MSKTNCQNCGAALDICTPKCIFCGTKNVNMTDIDLASGEAVNFIFKLPNNFKNAQGQEIFLSMLAIPKLENMELTNDETYATDGFGREKLAYVNNYSFAMGISLQAVPSRESKPMTSIIINKGE